MPRLLRTMLGLLAINAACIALVLALTYSASGWNCIGFMTTDGYGVLDAIHGAYIVEAELAPNGYNINQWMFLNGGELGYFERILSSQDKLRRSILVDQTHVRGYLDSKINSVASFFSLSPDSQYFAFYAQDQANSVMTIYDTATFTQVVSARLNGTPSARTISGSIYGPYAADWSPSATWLAFTTFASNTLTLNLMSVQTGEVQMVNLGARGQNGVVKWSPTSTALVVLSNTAYANPLSYLALDMVILKDGHWQVIQRYETENLTSLPTILTKHVQVSWTRSGNTFSALRAQPQPPHGYELMKFNIDGTSERTTVTPNNRFFPALILNGDWLCTANENASMYTLRPVEAMQPIIPIDTTCNAMYASPDGSAFLARQLMPDAPSEWIVLRTSPFKMFPLNGVGLPSTMDEIQWSFQISQWSKTNRFIFLSSRIDATNTPRDRSLPDDAGHLIIIDTTTGHWLTVPRLVSTDLMLTISPDESRFVAWSLDRRAILLFDIDANLLATIPMSDISPDSMRLDWSPDSLRFLLTAQGTPIPSAIRIFDRDGQLLTTFDQPAQFKSWIMNYGYNTRESWSRCTPLPKFPRMSLSY